MWGFASRGTRLADARRAGRTFDSGLVRATVRGSVEHAVIDIEGELDFTSAEEMAIVVGRLPHRIVMIDVSSLDFIDAAGVRSLRTISRSIEERTGNRPSITGMSGAVRRAFDLVLERQPVLV